MVTQVTDISAALDTMERCKQGGLYVPKENLWLIQPPEDNPDYEQQIEDFREAVANLNLVQPSSTRRHHQESVPDSYPLDVRQDADVELLPGLSGDKVLEMTTSFVRNASPATLAVLGSLAGLVAYKSMGLKGVAGLILAMLALKRFLRMGDKAIADQRLDLIARGIRDGIPVNKDGKINADFLDALRHSPAGDNKMATRRIDPAIQTLAWGNHVVKTDSFALESFDETVCQVMDGDAFVGSRGHYRLIGIDVPDTIAQGSSHLQSGAQKAWTHLRELIPPGAPVRVEVASNQPPLYGRIPCYLYAKNGRGVEVCVNKLLVEEGLARVTNHQPHHPKILEFVEASLNAIASRKGLWNAAWTRTPSSNPSLVPVIAAIN